MLAMSTFWVGCIGANPMSSKGLIVLLVYCEANFNLARFNFSSSACSADSLADSSCMRAFSISSTGSSNSPSLAICAARAGRSLASSPAKTSKVVISLCLPALPLKSSTIRSGLFDCAMRSLRVIADESYGRETVGLVPLPTHCVYFARTLVAVIMHTAATGGASKPSTSTCTFTTN